MLSEYFFQVFHYQPYFFLSSPHPVSHHRDTGLMEHLKYLMQPSDLQSFNPHLLQLGPAKISAGPWPLADCLGKGSFDPPSSQSTYLILSCPIKAPMFLLSTLLPKKSSPKPNSFLSISMLLPCNSLCFSLQPLHFFFYSFSGLFSFLMRHSLPEVRINNLHFRHLLIHQ